MLRDKQIDFCVHFWTQRLPHSLGKEKVICFQKNLSRLMAAGRDNIRAVSVNVFPLSELRKALKDAEIPPEILMGQVDMVFNDTGTIDICENRHWETITP